MTGGETSLLKRESVCVDAEERTAQHSCLHLHKTLVGRDGQFSSSVV